MQKEWSGNERTTVFISLLTPYLQQRIFMDKLEIVRKTVIILIVNFGYVKKHIIFLFRMSHNQVRDTYLPSY